MHGPEFLHTWQLGCGVRLRRAATHSAGFQLPAQSCRYIIGPLFELLPDSFHVTQRHVACSALMAAKLARLAESRHATNDAPSYKMHALPVGSASVPQQDRVQAVLTMSPDTAALGSCNDLIYVCLCTWHTVFCSSKTPDILAPGLHVLQAARSHCSLCTPTCTGRSPGQCVLQAAHSSARDVTLICKLGRLQRGLQTKMSFTCMLGMVLTMAAGSTLAL
jgi:hypothetical protein